MKRRHLVLVALAVTAIMLIGLVVTGGLRKTGILSAKPAAAITYNVECFTNPYYPPIKSGSGTSVNAASLVCFRNIANSVFNSSCVAAVYLTGNNPTRAGRTGRIVKGESDHGYPWYCGSGSDGRNVTSYIP